MAHWYACCVALFLCLASPLLIALAQTSLAPEDPAAFLALAREKNGLDSPEVQPWHLRGTYTFFDRSGKVDDSGVYEEWWVSPSKYKRSFTSSKFTQVEYANGTGLYRVGSQDWAGGNEMLLRADLLDPLPESEVLKEFKLQRHTDSIANGKFDCVTLSYRMRSNVTVSKDYFPAYCFDPGLPVLRLSSTGSSSHAAYNQIVSFQDRYVARDLKVSFLNEPRIEFTLEVIESLKESPDAVLKLPPNATPVDLTSISLTADAARNWPVKLKQASPSYPEEAKHRGIQGTVVMQVKIGKDGHVTGMDVVSGPELLQGAARNTVQQWMYRPFEVMGEPRVVTIEARIIFTLG
jgi:protein TonB